MNWTNKVHDSKLMTKEELLEWAKWNFNHWNDPKAMSPKLWAECADIGSQSSWYILLEWAEHE